MTDTTCDQLIAAHERIVELEAENKRLWRMSCEGYAIDSQVHDDLKAMVRAAAGGLIPVPSRAVLEWAGVE